MSAVPKWASMRQTVLDDARLANGEAHIEPHEVPQLIDEDIRAGGCDDLGSVLSHAVSDIEDGERLKLTALLARLLRDGEKFPLESALDLLGQLRTAMTAHCLADLQAMVDRELYA